MLRNTDNQRMRSELFTLSCESPDTGHAQEDGLYAYFRGVYITTMMFCHLHNPADSNINIGAAYFATLLFRN